MIKKITRRLRTYFLQSLAAVFSHFLPPAKRRFFVTSSVFSNALFGQEKGLTPNEAQFIYSFAKMHRPKMVLETGTCMGYSTSFIAHALIENRVGHCYTIELNPWHYKKARSNLRSLGLTKVVTACEGDTRECIRRFIRDNTISNNLDLVFLDSGTPATIEEFELLHPHIRSGTGYLICHDVFDPKRSGKGVVLYPYLRDKYSKRWDLCVLRTDGAGFVVARKRGSDNCDAYKSLDSYNIKDFQDYLTNWLPKIAG